MLARFYARPELVFADSVQVQLPPVGNSDLSRHTVVGSKDKRRSYGDASALLNEIQRVNNSIRSVGLPFADIVEDDEGEAGMFIRAVDEYGSWGGYVDRERGVVEDSTSKAVHRRLKWGDLPTRSAFDGSTAADDALRLTRTKRGHTRDVSKTATPARRLLLKRRRNMVEGIEADKRTDKAGAMSLSSAVGKDKSKSVVRLWYRLRR